VTLQRVHALEARSNAAGGVRFVLPGGFINQSGPVCKRFLEWSGTRLDQCVFVHDCVERKRGDLKLHRGGSASGHNGVRSLHESLRTRDFWRLRVGIGRPQVGTLHDYVLDQIDAAERRDFDSLFRSFIVEYLGKLEADLQASTSEQSVPAARGPVTPHAP
jgi:PTH1 family peptidyl-tRNA hydrolase